MADTERLAEALEFATMNVTTPRGSTTQYVLDGGETEARDLAEWLASPDGLRVLTETLSLVEDRVDLRVVYGYELGYREAANEITTRLDEETINYVSPVMRREWMKAVEIARSFGAAETGDTTGKLEI